MEASKLRELKELLGQASKGPWEATMVQPNMGSVSQWYIKTKETMPPRGYGIYATDGDVGLIVAVRNQLEELLDYVSLLEAQYSDLMFECSSLHEERRVWWTGDKRTEPTMSEDVATALRDLTEVLKTPEPDHGTVVVELPTRWGEDYTTGTGQKLRVHARENCVLPPERPYCVIHAPQPGPWELWPTHWRSEWKFMERICPHGVGHPVVEGNDRERSVAHGCCGCPCAPEAG